MMLTHQLTVEEVNNLESETFVRIFGNTVEHFPAAAIAILKNRPFLDIDDIIKAVTDFLDSLKVYEKERILQLYPDVVNKLFYSSQLPLKREIRGSDHLTVDDKTKLRELDDNYKVKFGFPFIIDNKEKDVNTIFSEIISRLQNSKEKEIDNTMRIVKNIVKLRIHEIVR
ncbi:2-oxo-4-hydroxy-4-carboxy-5-ureidoimidazoline decarboxylase [Anoplophora glabripennis]|nr:2-oxo-4-hydroxy-4-carboxy-5-ureidoimidazoline decarboxylase [Anoplophora glabripennis]